MVSTHLFGNWLGITSSFHSKRPRRERQRSTVTHTARQLASILISHSISTARVPRRVSGIATSAPDTRRKRVQSVAGSRRPEALCGRRHLRWKSEFRKLCLAQGRRHVEERRRCRHFLDVPCTSCTNHGQAQIVTLFLSLRLTGVSQHPPCQSLK